MPTGGATGGAGAGEQPALLLFGPGWDFDAAMAATRRYTAFLPDMGCVLMASLAFVDADLGTDRALYPCIRQECACAGVFYNSYGGSGSRLRVRVWIEAAPTSSSSSSSSSSSTSSTSSASSASLSRTAATCVAPEVAAELTEFFQARVPEVTLCYGGTTSAGGANPSEVVSTDANRAWLPDASVLGGGVWEVTFRPLRITGDTSLAQLKVCAGVNEVWSAGFEVRTKPSEWLLLQQLPAEWTTDAHVRTFLAACTKAPPTAVVLRATGANLPVAAVDATGVSLLADGAGAGAGAATKAVAFVRFESRAKACGALVGFKTHVAAASGDKKAKAKKAVGSCPPPAGFQSVVVSLCASVNRMFADDAALSRAVVPSHDIATMVQDQPRPSYLPPLSAAVTKRQRAQAAPIVVAAAAVTDVVASGKRQRCVGGDDDTEAACRVASPLPQPAGHSPYVDADSDASYDSDDFTDCDTDDDGDVERVVVPVLPIALSRRGPAAVPAVPAVPAAPAAGVPSPPSSFTAPLAWTAGDVPSPLLAAALEGDGVCAPSVVGGGCDSPLAAVFGGSSDAAASEWDAFLASL